MRCTRTHFYRRHGNSVLQATVLALTTDLLSSFATQAWCGIGCRREHAMLLQAHFRTVERWVTLGRCRLSIMGGSTNGDS